MSDVKPRRGRPRDTEVAARIIAAAAAILAEHGIGAVTIEAVAARSGAGKPTIYRHWPNAQALVMAALVADEAGAAPPPASASALADLARQLAHVAQVFATRRGLQAARMVAAADGDSEVGKAFRSQVILKSRDAGRDLLRRAVATGEVRADLDIEAALDAVYGAVFFRVLIGHAPLDAAFTRTLLDQQVDGLRPLASGPRGEPSIRRL